MALYSAPTINSRKTSLEGAAASPYSSPSINSRKKSPEKSVEKCLSRPRHQCEFCSKIFASAFALNMHVRIHTGEKPFECEICGAKFSVKGNMKRHQISHLSNTIS